MGRWAPEERAGRRGGRSDFRNCHRLSGQLCQRSGLFLILLLPTQLDHLALVFNSILLTIMASAITGTAVGALAPRSARAVRIGAVVGVVFGVALGIANAAVAPVVRFAVATLVRWTSISDPSAVGYGALVVVVGVIVDIALAIAALLWLRRRWDSRSPANGV